LILGIDCCLILNGGYRGGSVRIMVMRDRGKLLFNRKLMMELIMWLILVYVLSEWSLYMIIKGDIEWREAFDLRLR
uniref:hypothetical protein n=1 Tax=Bacillus pumilus TaxID=1408 RepID=UPI001C930A49